MNQARKALNWVEICSGRDLLNEIELLKQNVRLEVEIEIRKRISDEILNPREFRFKTGCAGDSLD